MKKRNLLKKDRRRFWCLLGLLLLLTMVRYALQIDVPRVVFLAVIAAIALLGDQDEIIAMCICCIPLHESIDFFYALVICIGVYVFKFYKQIRLGTNVLLLLLIIIWELLHCFLTQFDAITFLANMIPFIVLAVIMASNVEKLDYALVVRAFAWATLGVILVMFIRVLYFSGFNIARALEGLQRLGSDKHSNIENVTVAGGQINSNSLGIIAVLASTGLMQLRKTVHGKTSDIVLMCIMLVFASLGASRTYLACLALMVILLIFAEKGGITKKLRLFAVLLLAIASAVALLAIFFPENLRYYASRFAVKDITTGRDNLMIVYHRFIVKNPKVLFFGIGLQDFGNRLINLYRVSSNVPHNSIQELMAAWGIPGLFLFAALILNMYQTSRRYNRRHALIHWIPLIIILFKGIAGQMLNSSYTMLAFSYAYLSLCADLTPKAENRIFFQAPKAHEGLEINI